MPASGCAWVRRRATAASASTSSRGRSEIQTSGRSTWAIRVIGFDDAVRWRSPASVTPLVALRRRRNTTSGSPGLNLACSPTPTRHVDDLAVGLARQGQSPSSSPRVSAAAVAGFDTRSPAAASMRQTLAVHGASTTTAPSGAQPRGPARRSRLGTRIELAGGRPRRPLGREGRRLLGAEGGDRLRFGGEEGADVPASANCALLDPRRRGGRPPCPRAARASSSALDRKPADAVEEAQQLGLRRRTARSCGSASTPASCVRRTGSRPGPPSRRCTDRRRRCRPSSRRPGAGRVVLGRHQPVARVERGRDRRARGRRRPGRGPDTRRRRRCGGRRRRRRAR